MMEQTLAALRVKAGGKYIDCTTGEGGHSLAISGAATPAPFLLCLDRDAKALMVAAQRMQGFSPEGHTVFAHANYADVASVAADNGFQDADGILMDLGLSSLQLDNADRGFSIRQEATLDMRFDTTQQTTAYEVVNQYTEQTLADIIYRYGEEWRSRRIARAIVSNRPITTTTQLADIAGKAAGMPKGRTRSRIHPATRTFQAIRIAVNGEMDALERGLDGAMDTLGAGGRLAVISYHSVEDRLVKNTLRQSAAVCVCPTGLPECVCGHQPTIKIINRRVIKPSAEEVRSNPRSRSARMRVAERIGGAH